MEELGWCGGSMIMGSGSEWVLSATQRCSVSLPCGSL